MSWVKWRDVREEWETFILPRCSVETTTTFNAKEASSLWIINNSICLFSVQHFFNFLLSWSHKAIYHQFSMQSIESKKMSSSSFVIVSSLIERRHFLQYYSKSCSRLDFYLLLQPTKLVLLCPFFNTPSFRLLTNRWYSW